MSFDLLAADVVFYSGSDGSGEARLSGEIVTWTRSTLELKLDSGQVRSLDGRRVLKTAIPQDPAVEQALFRMDQKEYTQAAALFQEIIQRQYQSGDKSWRLIELHAFQTRCYQNLDDIDAAAMRFALLNRAAPDSHFLFCAPLVWSSCSPSNALTDSAQKWTRQTELPFLRLLGASILLTGPDKQAAQFALDQLSRDPDADINHLARFQLARLQLSPLAAEELKRLETMFNELSWEYQAGPAFQLGRLWTLTKTKEGRDRAAIYYLKSAWNPHQSDPLAARSLYSAGKILEESQNREEAIAIFNELLKRFPQSSWADEAKRVADQFSSTAADKSN